MEDLKYKMIMALSAADIANPLCAEVAEICAEIADQHCTQLHVNRVSEVPEVLQVTTPGQPRL